MSVGILVTYQSQDKDDVYFPIAGEHSYAKYWNISSQLPKNLKSIPLFQTGLSIYKNDLDEVIAEFELLENYYQNSDNIDPDLSLSMTKRICELRNFIQEIDADEVAEYFFG